MVRRLSRLLALALASVFWASCESGQTSSAKVAQDRERGVTFSLSGDRLTVSIAPTARATRERLMARRLRLFCGRPEEFGPFGASARAKGRLSRSSREVTVRLSKDVSKDVGFCGAEGGSGEAFGFFPSEEEVLRRASRSRDQREHAALHLATVDGRPREAVKYRRALATIAAKCRDSYDEIAAFAEQMTERLEVEKRSPGGYNNLRTLHLLNASAPRSHRRPVGGCSGAFADSLIRERERRSKKERDGMGAEVSDPALPASPPVLADARQSLT